MMRNQPRLMLIPATTKTFATHVIDYHGFQGSPPFCDVFLVRFHEYKSIRILFFRLDGVRIWWYHNHVTIPSRYYRRR